MSMMNVRKTTKNSVNFFNQLLIPLIFAIPISDYLQAFPIYFSIIFNNVIHYSKALKKKPYLGWAILETAPRRYI